VNFSRTFAAVIFSVWCFWLEACDFWSVKELCICVDLVSCWLRLISNCEQMSLSYLEAFHLGMSVPKQRTYFYLFCSFKAHLQFCNSFQHFDNCETWTCFTSLPYLLVISSLYSTNGVFHTSSWTQSVVFFPSRVLCFIGKPWNIQWWLLIWDQSCRIGLCNYKRTHKSRASSLSLRKTFILFTSIPILVRMHLPCLCPTGALTSFSNPPKAPSPPL